MKTQKIPVVAKTLKIQAAAVAVPIVVLHAQAPVKVLVAINVLAHVLELV